MERAQFLIFEYSYEASLTWLMDGAHQPQVMTAGIGNKHGGNKKDKLVSNKHLQTLGIGKCLQDKHEASKCYPFERIRG